jgi:mannose-6-phosphate isomerase-like protein (cupin superfamily)
VGKTRRAFIKNAGAITAIAVMGRLKSSSASPNHPTAARRAGKHGSSAGSTRMRCVITGQTKSGKSVIVSSAAPEPVTVGMLPGWEFYNIWGSDSQPQLPSDGTEPPHHGYFPPTSGFRFGIFVLPPATSKTGRLAPGSTGSAASARAQQSDAQQSNAGQSPTPAEIEELRQKLPGVAESSERDHPGMHTTDTVDFDVVISGEVVMELDDGAEVLLKAGDCVVQNGTRHAWYNRSAENCVIAYSLIGAQRKPA